VAGPHSGPSRTWPRAVWFMSTLGKRYGSAFTVKLPFFGPTVIISDPRVGEAVLPNPDRRRGATWKPNLDLVLGPGSTFGLQDEAHRQASQAAGCPPFHGKRMRAYEGLVEEENPQGDRLLGPRAENSKNPSLDDADHPQRDPARGVWRRGQRVRCVARGDAARW